MFALFRKTTIYGLGSIPTPYTKLSAWYVHVHNRPSLYLCVNMKPLRECLDVAIILRPSRTDGDRILAVASKGGYPKHPEWYLNLLAHPKVTVEVGSEKFDTTARILTGNEREQAFTRAVEVFPPYGAYQKRTTREIPVIALERPAK